MVRVHIDSNIVSFLEAPEACLVLLQQPVTLSVPLFSMEG